MLSLPNLLTLSRIVAVPLLVAFLWWPSWQAGFGIAFALYCLMGITDYFDGYLARAQGTVSKLGVFLDPIADKVLITGAILGVLASGSLPGIALPCGLILFREFAVSALRETMAGRIELPVTLAAKWKTTVQMVALAALQLTLLWDAFGLQNEDGSPLSWQPAFESFAVFLIWFAAVITLWTGWQYFREARRQMQDL